MTRHTKGKMTRALAGLMLACALATGTVTAIAPHAVADSRSDLVKEKQKKEQQLESMQSSLEGIDTQIQDVVMKLEEARTQIPVAEAELQAAQAEVATAERQQQAVASQLDAAEGELAGIHDDIEDAKEKIGKSRDSLGEIARAAYRGQTLPSTLDLLLGTSSTTEFSRRKAASDALTRSQAATLAQVEASTAANQTRQARQEDVKSQIEDLKAEADALLKEKADKQAAAKQKADDLAAAEANFTSQQDALNASKASYQASIEATQAEISATAAAIASIDRQNAAAANSGGSSGGNAPAGGGSSTPQANTGSGNWIIPVVPAPFYVTSPYGMRNYPFGGRFFHIGVDIRSACGQPQVAPANGVIAKVIPAPGNSTHGNQIYVNLGTVNGSSWVAVTNHLSAFNVRVGQAVTKGQVIGWTGQTGKVTGCHVHMEIWKNGKHIDPLSLPGFTRAN